MIRWAEVWAGTRCFGLIFVEWDERAPFILADFKTAGTRLLAFLFSKSTVNLFFRHFIPQVIEIYQFVHRGFELKFSYLVVGICKLKK